MNVDVVVALGSAAGDDLGPLPANDHVEAFVHQNTVLRHAALVVHHGGSGTLLGALSIGVPQLLLPKGADQFFNADAVNRSDLAPVLEPSHATADKIASAAELALAIGLREGAAAARDEIATLPHPSVVLDELVRRVLSVGASN